MDQINMKNVTLEIIEKEHPDLWCVEVNGVHINQGIRETRCICGFKTELEARQFVNENRTRLLHGDAWIRTGKKEVYTLHTDDKFNK